MIDENDDDYTVDCPNCGEPIYEDVAQCPYCGDYVTSTEFGHRFPKWVVIIILLTILTFLLPALAVIWNSLDGR